MKLLVQSFDRPEENLAFEEWYFNHFEEETLRLWINPDSVIVGKHQNAFAECNQSYCEQQAIPVLRRISGGGTVFHDMGNINFSFFRFVEKSKQIEYKRNLDLIQGALLSLGYDVTQSTRHDLFMGDFKISGNAQHVSKGRALHHGTILYSTNKEKLSKAIKRDKGLFEDKGVKSVRSAVRNLQEIKSIGSSRDFLLQLAKAVDTSELSPFHSDLSGLVSTKYQDWNWNFGYGPAFEFKSSIDDVPIQINVLRGGKIEECSPPWREHLKGSNFRSTDIKEILEKAEMEAFQVERLLNALF